MNAFPPFSEHPRDAHHRNVQDYDRWATLQRKSAEYLFDMLPEDFEPNVVADLGCGSGYLLKLLQQRYRTAQLLGVDFDRRRTGWAKTVFAEHPHIRIVESTIEDFLKTSPLSFDLVVSNFALHWSMQVDSVLGCIARGLEKKGKFAISLPTKGSLTTLHRVMREEGVPIPLTFQPESYWLTRTEKSGLQLQESRSFELIQYYASAREALSSVHRTGTLPPARRGAFQKVGTMKRLLHSLEKKGSEKGIPIGYRIWQAVFGVK
jgi:malonyl-CoA O-methyltransferase